jgi:hypothetical protein
LLGDRDHLRVAIEHVDDRLRIYSRDYGSRTSGKPAIDPKLIAANIKKLRPILPINTGHPFLDLSVKTGLVHIDATFRVRPS